MNPYELASLADCHSPYANGSPGAIFLLRVRDGLLEHFDWCECLPRDRHADAVHEIADGAPDAYDYPRWQEFVDLGAWERDISEVTGDLDLTDLTDAAGLALCMIAEELLNALLALDDPTEDEEEA